MTRAPASGIAKYFKNIIMVYLQCFLLCLLSMAISLFVFKGDSLGPIEGHLHLHFLWGGWSRFIFDAFCLLCLVSAILAMLRSIPLIGVFLQWGIWLILSISYHLFYRVMYRFPEPQDLRNLLVTTPWKMASETILSTLSINSILLGLAPVAIVVMSYILINRLFNRSARHMRFIERIGVYAVGFAILGAYCYHQIYPTTFFADAFANSLHILDMYCTEADYYKVPRSPYITDTPQDAPSDNVVLIVKRHDKLTQ